MSELIVCKFGGSSVADAAQIEKVRGIVAANPDRRVVIVSAPGKRSSDEQKVTDHLINIATGGAHFRDQHLAITARASRDAIIAKFETIAGALEIEADDLLESLRRDLDTNLDGDLKTAFLASRGEHYNARMIARYFSQRGIASQVRLPEDFGLLVEGYCLDAKLVPEAHENIRQVLDDDSIAVVPGYYGVTRDGDVAVFSRGGSDLTGGEVAYALNADCYENWTDVSGVFEADPRIIPQALPIRRLTFKEIRLLSAKGFEVFHLNAMLRCKERKIPINIRNTNQPEDDGTIILSERVPEEEGIVGIARLDNVAYLYLEKDMLGEEVGFTAKLLRIFQDFGISTYHYPTDKDDIAVLVNQDDLTGRINDLRREIEEHLKPDFMDVMYNLSILTPVGVGLKGNYYPIVDALTALAEDHIPLEMIDQSPSQICFHIGVRQAVADDALKILHKALIEKRR